MPGTADLVERVSPYSFVETLEKVSVAIQAAGMTVMARIDHAAAAESVGLSMPPTTVLLYGNPIGGTPIMQAHPIAALDLPLRVLVREGIDGKVWAGFHPIVELLGRAEVPDALAARLEPAQKVLVAAIAQ